MSGFYKWDFDTNLHQLFGDSESDERESVTSA